MSAEIVKLARLTFCPCGGPVLEDHIEIGTEYSVYRDTKTPMTYFCGSCGAKHHVIGILCDDRLGSIPGYLPSELFDVEAIQ